MTSQEAIENLFKTIELSENAMAWLKRSYGICEQIGFKDDYSDEEFDAFETLTSRYARISDILIHKVFRAIDTVELEYGGPSLMLSIVPINAICLNLLMKFGRLRISEMKLDMNTLDMIFAEFSGMSCG